MYLCEDADDNEGYVPRSPLWIKETQIIDKRNTDNTHVYYLLY